MKRKCFIDYFFYFLLYSLIGWIYEVVLEVFIYKWGYSDRGVLTGPYLPIYGIGALLFIILFYRLIKGKDLKKKLIMIPVVFLGCMLAATLLELVASYLLEWTTGAWPWQTYEDYAINFEARIALSPSIRFGLGGLLFLYVLQPLFERLVGAIPKRIKRPLFILLGVIFLVDVIHFLWTLL